MERDFVQFLQDLRAEGEVDSSGTFTIDQREARRKLRHYQLLHPHHYVAPLLPNTIRSERDFLKKR